MAGLCSYEAERWGQFYVVAMICQLPIGVDSETNQLLNNLMNITDSEVLLFYFILFIFSSFNNKDTNVSIKQDYFNPLV